LESSCPDIFFAFPADNDLAGTLNRRVRTEQ
jgi:hypothetical protein